MASMARRRRYLLAISLIFDLRWRAPRAVLQDRNGQSTSIVPSFSERLHRILNKLQRSNTWSAQSRTKRRGSPTATASLCAHVMEL